MRTIIGIDNGLSGAVAVLFNGQCVSIGPTPTKHKTGDRGELDEAEMWELLWSNVEHENTAVYIEDTHVQMGNVSRVSIASMNKTLGVWCGLCTGMNVPYTLVPSKEWQRAMLPPGEKGETKTKAIATAKKLFPKVSLRRTSQSRKDDHNLADALLIAEYARRSTGAITNASID